MKQTTVAVLRGGPSSEYEVSLKTGASVLRNLPEDVYTPVDVWIAKDGTWHARGKAMEPERALSGVDVVFNALHGEYGEDGTVQRELENIGIPYTGSRSVESAIAMQKHMTKERLADAGVQLARGTVVAATDDLTERIKEIIETFTQPVVIKPVSGGSSIGVSFATGRFALRTVLTDMLQTYSTVLVEEYIPGREATCGVIDGFRGETEYTLLPIEIVPKETQTFFDYDAKYAGQSELRCPTRFTAAENDVLQDAARRVHKTLGLRHYSRSDFIVGPEGVYFLEVNTLPGLTETSLVPTALAAAGGTLPELLDHLIVRALAGK